MKTLKKIYKKKYTSVYEICLKNLSLTALALLSFAFKKNCEDKEQDQQEYPRPLFIDISPKPMC